MIVPSMTFAYVFDARFVQISVSKSLVKAMAWIVLMREQ